MFKCGPSGLRVVWRVAGRFDDIDIDLGREAMMSLFTRTMMVVAVQRDQH
jgi:hypothetical protein